MASSILSSHFFLLATIASTWNHFSASSAAVVSFQVCSSPPKWTSNGQDVMHDLLGNVTLLALADLSDKFCQSQVIGLARLADVLKQHYNQGTKFVIVAGRNDSPVLVDRYRRTVKEQSILFLHETAEEPIWDVVGGNRNDFFIYDSCGRLNYYIPYPQSFLYYHYTTSSLHSAHRDQRCGACDPNKVKNIRLQHVKAWIRPEKGNDAAGQVKIIARPNTGGKNSVIISTSERPTVRYTINHEKKPSETRKTWTKSYDAEMMMTTTASTTKHKHRHGDVARSYVGGSASTTSPIEGSTATVLSSRSAADPSFTSPSKINVADVTTHRVEIELNETTAQISAASPVTEPFRTNETKENPVGPAVRSEERQQVSSDTSTSQNGTEETETFFLVDHPQPTLNCTSYTDSFCYEQQLKGMQLNQCCKKGVYVTDMCSADRCTEETRALCCFQKFQQARFTCCHDEDVPYGRADDFNRCCYNRFAGGRDWINGQDDVDDPCCDRITANIFWRHPGRIAELCLPNINIDYSNLEIDVKLRDGTEKSIELKELVALRYDCPYLHKRSNFYRYDI